MASEPMIEIRVESLYGARTDSPLVKLIVGSQEVIMSPEKSRQIAHQMTEAADAAYGDAFMVRFIEHKIGATRPQATLILREFREWRELQRRTEQEINEADEEAMRGHA